MTNNTDDFVNALLESTCWTTAGFDVGKKKEVVSENQEVASEEEKVDEEVEVEAHVCPLCESSLDKPLDRENVELFVEALFTDDEDLLAESEDDEDSEDVEDDESEE